VYEPVLPDPAKLTYSSLTLLAPHIVYLRELVFYVLEAKELTLRIKKLITQSKDSER
jgi:hypothetical protein